MKGLAQVFAVVGRNARLYLKGLSRLVAVLVIISIPLSLILMIWGVHPDIMIRIFGTSFIIFTIILINQAAKDKKKKEEIPKPKSSKFADRIKELQNEKK